MVSLIEALFVGAFAAITIIYTFQTRILYPIWVIKAYDKPWLFVILFIIAVSLSTWSTKVSVMLVLLLGALWLDGLIFLRAYDEKDEAPVKSVGTKEDANLEVWPFEEPNVARSPEAIAGPPLHAVPLPEPQYPVFYGVSEDILSGPAPF